MLEDLNEDPGELLEPPALPEGGIPQQKLPLFVIKIIQSICLPYVLIEIQAQKIAKKIIKPPFIRKGECKKRGNCCYYIRLRKVKGFNFIQKFWATQINGFYFRSKETVAFDDNKEYYMMGCRHLKKDGKCGNYLLRPLICRTWPIIEHFGYPRVLKGCGYRAEIRDQEKNKDYLHVIQ